MDSARDIDSGLLEHARLGLKRIHTISKPVYDPEVTASHGTSKNDKRTIKFYFSKNSDCMCCLQ